MKRSTNERDESNNKFGKGKGPIKRETSLISHLERKRKTLNREMDAYYQREGRVVGEIFFVDKKKKLLRTALRDALAAGAAKKKNN